MKSKIILRITFLLATVIIMVTCKKSDIDKARDAYSPSKVVPIVQGINGSKTVLQTKKYIYSVNYDRAGSVWNWTTTDATVDSTSPDKRTVRVLFGTKPANDTALIKVTETTAGGATSPEKILKAKVKPFCPLALSGFAGQWDCVQKGKSPSTNKVATLVQGTGDVIIIKAVEDLVNNPPGFLPALFDSLYISWGERFQTGHGHNGDIWLHVNTDNGAVTINRENWGQTLPGPYDYEYSASTTGLWDNCGAKPVITLTFSLYGYSGYTQNVVLTKK